MSAKTLTKIYCKAQGAAKASSRKAALDKIVTKALKVSSSTRDSHTEVTAGHWTRNTAKKLSCLVYVSNLASVRFEVTKN